MSAADILRKARERVARGWTQGQWAADANGKRVGYAKPEATCWCAVGAVRAEAVKALVPSGNPLFFLAEAVDVDDEDLVGEVTAWNDDPARTQAEVLAAFDRAIALTEAP